jgi:hypothetical protein
MLEDNLSSVVEFCFYRLGAHLFSLLKVGKTTANKPKIITCINLQAQTAQGIPSSISICVVWNAA